MSETLKKLKPIWVQDGTDFICHLGLMKKAIIVRKYTTDSSWKNTFYSISEASYFPFTNEQYDTRFSHAYDACILAENHIKDWFNSLLISESNMLESENKLNEGTNQFINENN